MPKGEKVNGYYIQKENQGEKQGEIKMEFRNSFDSAFGVVKYDFTESNFLDYQVTEIYSSLNCRMLGYYV